LFHAHLVPRWYLAKGARRRADFTFRNGLIARIDGFTDKAEALEAARLSE